MSEAPPADIEEERSQPASSSDPIQRRQIEALPRRSFLTRLREAACDLLFPPRCASCGRPGSLFCDKCIEQLAYLPSRLCSLCGSTPFPGGQSVGHTCLCVGSPLVRCRSVAYAAGPLRKMIHRLKYHDGASLARPMGRIMAQWWLANGWDVGLVVPVPLHPLRLRERGFNQAELLSRSFCQFSQLPHDASLLTRSRHTRPQVGLNAAQRKENVKDAFVAHGELVRERPILLIDDVMTTGFTLLAAAQALKKAGAGPLSALTMARAVQNDQFVPRF